MVSSLNVLDTIQSEIDATSNKNRKEKLQRLYDYVRTLAERSGKSIYENNCMDAVNEENIDLHPYLVEFHERGLVERQ